MCHKRDYTYDTFQTLLSCELVFRIRLHLKMDENGFPTIVTNVDYTEIAPIQQKRTIAFINHFVASTVTFLNKFAESCEKRLERFNDQLQKAEAALCILEAKLSSIEGLDNVSIPATDDKGAAMLPEANSDPVREDTTPVNQPLVVAEAEVAPSEETKRPKMSQDPRYARFFRMVHVGVPLQAVKQKMLVEGLDPSILDNPDAEAPDSASVTHPSKEDSDSESGTIRSFNSSFSD